MALNLTGVFLKAKMGLFSDSCECRQVWRRRPHNYDQVVDGPDTPSPGTFIKVYMNEYLSLDLLVQLLLSELEKPAGE